MIQTLLFTGHMIDSKSRAAPRFPASIENKVKAELRECLLQEKALFKNNMKGIASGACGGDILFHELCREIDIPTEMYLALPVDEFKKKSVSFAGEDWEKRYDQLNKILPVLILAVSNDNNNTQNVWERTNLWMLDTALENGGENMSLIALWDGKAGDGNGGTEHMVSIAKEQGARIRILDITQFW